MPPRGNGKGGINKGSTALKPTKRAGAHACMCARVLGGLIFASMCAPWLAAVGLLAALRPTDEGGTCATNKANPQAPLRGDGERAAARLTKGLRVG